MPARRTLFIQPPPRASLAPVYGALLLLWLALLGLVVAFWPSDSASLPSGSAEGQGAPAGQSEPAPPAVPGGSQRARAWM